MNQTNPSARGDQTREALLSAAIETFGRDGYHPASTRAIARAAGVNQALIGYHFGGKQGLYLAVFEHIAEQIAADALPAVRAVAQELDSIEAGMPATAGRALQSLEMVMLTIVGQLSRASASGWPRILVREQQDPTVAFDVLYDRFWQPLLAVLSRLVGLLLDIDPASRKARSRAMMIMGQVIFFLAARATTLRQMGWDSLGPEELEVVREQLLESLRAQFKVEALS